jgi:carboxypeptidase Taq
MQLYSGKAMAISLLSTAVLRTQAFAHSTASTAVKKTSSSVCTSSSLKETSASYKELLQKLQTIHQLKGVSTVLDYDRMVFMPEGSAAAATARAAQQSALAAVIHEKATDSSIPSLIQAALEDLKSLKEQAEDGSENDEDSSTLSSLLSEEERILDLTKTSFEKDERVPAELEAKRASLSSSAYSDWVKAREAKDFDMFAPVLEDCFNTAKELAKVRGNVVDDNNGGGDDSTSLYTQMLDEYEMGMSAERIDGMFDQIQKALVPLISKVLDKETTTPPSTAFLNGKFNMQTQKDLNRKIITTMGFDSNKGRIDVSVHPFTMSLNPSDVRITSRFSNDEWYQGLAATIHEGGHAMYEQNVGESGLEIDSYLSMGTHESQSLFWERHVGMSKAFWNWCTPLMKEAYAATDNNSEENENLIHSCTAEELYGAVNAVSPSLIRVEADELTYPLHVILRYNIERDVVEGKLDVKDIPKSWNEAMKTMLNVDVPDDSVGCLQDVHWSGLAIGYFPTYLIGSVTAAQLSYYCEKDIPDMYEQIERGEFDNIKAWLTDKVHRHGRRYSSLDALLEDQVGERLNPKYFINYLTDKYTSLYKC